MEWLFKKSNVTLEEVREIEKKLSVKFPGAFIKIVLEHNGAYIKPNIFDTKTTKGRVAESLLSFNLSDKMNILTVYSIIKERGENNLIPFMEDPFGNYICFDFSTTEPSVVFWNHEDNSIEKVADNFDSFFYMLTSKNPS